MTAYLKLDHIDKTFTRGAATTEVLKDVCLDIERGEFVSIIGHSGCGKSTLLNIVAGLTGATIGGVLLEDRDDLLGRETGRLHGAVLEACGTARRSTGGGGSRESLPRAMHRQHGFRASYGAERRSSVQCPGPTLPSLYEPRMPARLLYCMRSALLAFSAPMYAGV